MVEKTEYPVKELRSTIPKIFEAFDVGYDTAGFPLPDKPSMSLVNCGHRGHDYWDYLK